MNLTGRENKVNSFPQYGIESNLLTINDVETNQQLITKGKNFVASLDNRYQVLPNEQVMEQMAEIGKAVGLIPLDIAPKKWFYIQPDKSTIANKNKYGATTKVASILVSPEPYIMPDGKEIKLGLTVKNSIDGQWSFSASTFTFRTICENMMFHISRQKFAQVGDYLSMKADVNPDQLADHQVLQTSFAYKRHTRSLDVEKVAESLKQVFDEGKGYLERYHELSKLKMTRKIGLQIASQLPKWTTDSEPVKQWLDINKDDIKVDTDVSQWQAFNSVTEALTHEGKKFGTTLQAYAKTDRIFFS
jgi:hypothetical protein